MPPSVDVAIGTIFVFLLFSLVVSALNELILSYFDQRAKFLHMGLQEIFGESQDPANRAWRKGLLARISGGLLGKPIRLGFWTREIYQHGLINALSRTDGEEGTSPSYIPAGAFSIALLDLISKYRPAAPPVKAPTPNARSAFARVCGQVIQWLEGLSGASANNAVTLSTSLDQAVQTLQTTVQNWPTFAPVQTQLFNQKIAAAAKDPAALLAVAKELQTKLYLSATDDRTAANIEVWISNLDQYPRLQQSLRSLFIAAKKDADEFEVSLEAWFNAAMDRVAGWYKRFAQKWMIFIGFVLAASLNVDTIHIVRELSTTPNLAKAVASQAEHYVHDNQAPPGPAQAEAARKLEQQRVKDAEMALAAAEDAARNAQANLQKAKGQPMQGQAEAALKTAGDRVAAAQREVRDANDAADAEAKMRSAVARLSSTGIPMGWESRLRELDLEGKIPSLGQVINPWNWPDNTVAGFFPWLSAHWNAISMMLLGWFLTALAASLGAPFWFDTLSRFVNIRNAGRPPGEADTTSTPTKPPPATLDHAPTK